jgi:hypothetical protein
MASAMPKMPQNRRASAPEVRFCDAATFLASSIVPATRKWLFPDQLYHAKHHNLTTKTPRLATHFCKKPNKNTTPPQTRKNAARQRRTAFLTSQITR